MFCMSSTTIAIPMVVPIIYRLIQANHVLIWLNNHLNLQIEEWQTQLHQNHPKKLFFLFFSFSNKDVFYSNKQYSFSIIQTRPNWTELAELGRMDLIELEWIEVDWNWPKWTEVDWTGLK